MQEVSVVSNRSIAFYEFDAEMQLVTRGSANRRMRSLNVIMDFDQQPGYVLHSVGSGVPCSKMSSLSNAMTGASDNQ